MDAATYNARRRQLRRGERWHASESKRQELDAMFGGGSNPHGVFETHEEEELARAGKTFAVARLATGPAGLWVASGCTRGPEWGSSSSPSVWDVAHDSRHEARLYAILECLAQIESHLQLHSSEASETQAARMDRALRAML